MSCDRTTALALIMLLFWGGAGSAQGCLAPTRPFVPGDPLDAQEYADLIRTDFEVYLTDIQSYFRCLEDERTRAFNEAREVSEEYGRFIETVGR